MDETVCHRPSPQVVWHPRVARGPSGNAAQFRQEITIRRFGMCGKPLIKRHHVALRSTIVVQCAANSEILTQNRSSSLCVIISARVMSIYRLMILSVSVVKMLNELVVSARSSAFAAAKFACLTVLIFFGFFFVLLVILRFVNPPTTAVMLRDRLAGARIQHEWIPIKRISPNLVRAVISSEGFAFLQPLWCRSARNDECDAGLGSPRHRRGPWRKHDHNASCKKPISLDGPKSPAQGAGTLNHADNRVDMAEAADFRGIS